MTAPCQSAFPSQADCVTIPPSAPPPLPAVLHTASSPSSDRPCGPQRGTCAYVLRYWYARPKRPVKCCAPPTTQGSPRQSGAKKCGNGGGRPVRIDVTDTHNEGQCDYRIVSGCPLTLHKRSAAQDHPPTWHRPSHGPSYPPAPPGLSIVERHPACETRTRTSRSAARRRQRTDESWSSALARCPPQDAHATADAPSGSTTRTDGDRGGSAAAAAVHPDAPVGPRRRGYQARWRQQ